VGWSPGTLMMVALQKEIVSKQINTM